MHNARQQHLSQVSEHQTEENIYPVGQNEFQNDVHLVGVKKLIVTKLDLAFSDSINWYFLMGTEPVEILVVFILQSC